MFFEAFTYPLAQETDIRQLGCIIGKCRCVIDNGVLLADASGAFTDDTGEANEPDDTGCVEFVSVEEQLCLDRFGLW